MDETGRNIIELLKIGDIAAFDQIYKKYCSRLYGFVFHIIKTESDAEEIVQDVFVKLWESRGNLQSYKSFDSYLLTIAYNTTVSVIRKRISEKKYVNHILLMQEGISVPDSFSDLQFEQLFDLTYQAISQLPSRQKEIFLLNREKGLTYKEIAAYLQISENTVENHMVKALKFLQEKMKGNLLLGLLVFYIFH